MEDKVSNTVSIIGIPKTATMEQVINKQKNNFVLIIMVTRVCIDSNNLTHSVCCFVL